MFGLLVANYVYCPEFRIEGLRSKVMADVLQMRDGCDAYTLKKIPLFKLQKYELDHCFEIHLMSDCLNSIRPQGINFKEARVALLKVNKCAINIVGNLNFTIRRINLVKFGAIQSFRVDYVKDVVREQGLLEYLLEDDKLKKKTTRNIYREITRSYDEIVKEYHPEV